LAASDYGQPLVAALQPNALLFFWMHSSGTLGRQQLILDFKKI
jgi:hypothetical protein